jgi:divinyl protochlorophyllide a 8-vinyl-reductase
MHSAGQQADAVARMGPNAILQMGAALGQLLGSDARARLYRNAGLEGYLREPPGHMVPEAEVQALHAALRAELAPGVVRELSRRAGATTGDYLLANRIPKFAQWLLRALPRRLSARLLATAISKNAWTFVGGGTFSVEPAGSPGSLPAFVIRNSPLCRGLEADAPSCDYYAATFERLFRELVDRAATVVETECEAAGGGCCRFELR